MKEGPAPVPWTRNPVAWLMVGIPVLTVIAGFWTLWLAAGSGATDSHPDRVRRTAQVQEASLAADENAAALGLSARLQVDAGTTVVSLQPSPGPLAPVLRLVHPFESSRDRVVELSPGPRGWQGGSLAAAHAWQLQMTAADGSWRLVGRYTPGDTEVAMAPAVAGR
jgi:hypothetical protein